MPENPAITGARAVNNVSLAARLPFIFQLPATNLTRISGPARLNRRILPGVGYPVNLPKGLLHRENHMK
jgi:hypothetical protein